MRIVHTVTNATNLILYKNCTQNSLFNTSNPLLYASSFFLNQTELNLLENGLWMVYVVYPTGEIQGNLTESTTYILPPSNISLAPITWKTWLTLGILIVMIILLVIELLEPYGLIFTTVLILNFFNVLTIDEIKEGFANEAMLTVCAMNIVFEPVKRTNLPLKFFKFMFGKTHKFQRFKLFLMGIILGIGSAFIPTTPYASVVFSILLDWCKFSKSPTSKYFIPVMVIIIQGGILTAIGSSSTILVNSLLKAYNLPIVQFFDMFYVAGPAFILMLIYIITIGPFLLPNSSLMMETMIQKGKFYKCQWRVPKKYFGKKMSHLTKKSEFNDISIIELSRYDMDTNTQSTHPNSQNDEKQKRKKGKLNRARISMKSQILKPDPDLILEPRDVLFIEGSLENLTHFLTVTGVISKLKSNILEISNIGNTPLKNNFELKEMKIEKPDLQNSQPKEIKEEIKEVESKDEETKVDLSKKKEEINDDLSKKEEETNDDLPKEEETNGDLPKKEEETNGDLPKNEPTKLTKKDSITNNMIPDNYEFLEVVISDNNPYLNENYMTSQFIYKYQFFIIAIRKNGEIHENLCKFLKGFIIGDFKIETGDDLIVYAHSEFYKNWFGSKDFFYILNSHPEDKTTHTIELCKKKLKVWWYPYLSYPLIFACVVVASISSILNLGFSLLRCSIIVVCIYFLTQISNSEQLFSNINFKLVMLITSSILVGNSILKSGLATAFGLLIHLMNPPTYILPGIIFLICLVLTQFIHNDAAAAIFVPLIYGVSTALNVNIYPLIIAVSISSASSFATPFGFEVCLMAQSPGNYKFYHYLIYGFVPCIISFVISSVLIPLIWKI